MATKNYLKIICLGFVPWITVIPIHAQAETGTIIINKFTTPASTTEFGFTDDISAPNSFTLAHGQSQTFSDVPTGSYAVTENAPGPTYQLTAMTCLDPDGGSSVNLVTRTATIDLDDGETVECSFENELQNIAPPASIPTLNQWAVLGLILLLASTGLLVLRRRT